MEKNSKNLSLMEIFSFTISFLVLTLFLALFFFQKTPLIFSSVTANNLYAREAMYWERADSGVKCNLCPSYCYLTEGAKGKCKVRMNKDSTLYTEVYGQPAAVHIDPIEKKPVYHMLPGSMIFSIATVGCPLKCSFCQNWTLSQAYPEELKEGNNGTGMIISPEQIVQSAIQNGNKSIAFTYSEPVIYYEYMLDIAKLAKQYGLRNVMVTSGYFNPEPISNIAPYFDVIKVDLKGFSEKFYTEEVGGHLTNVLKVLKIIKEMNKLVEIVNLVIPQRNDSDDDFKSLCLWVMDSLGPDTPLFFTRFMPDYKLNNLPPTPLETLLRAKSIADKTGLHFVYIGNAPEAKGENTYCPDCHTLLIEREGYWIKKNIIKHGCCPVCGRSIPGIWE